MLQGFHLRFDVPVSDLDRAKAFYAHQLGLIPSHENEFSAQYRYQDSYFVLTPSASAGRGEHSILTWLVDDILATKTWLEDRGVEFNEYDLGDLKTSDGIAVLGSDQVAWFNDSEGNLLAIAEVE